MRAAAIETFTVFGVHATSIEVQVAVSDGYPVTTIVGLPDAAVRESRERIDGAFRASGMSPPPRKTVVNLAPAELRKEGSALDLPIALGILAAHGVIEPERLRNVVAVGELSLDGRVLPIRGALACALAVQERGTGELLLPAANRKEVEGLAGVAISPIQSLEALKCWISGEPIPPPVSDEDASSAPLYEPDEKVDFASIAGQHTARRALEVAAAGGHNVLLIGPPGTGKTLLASALATILPPMDESERLEATLVHSVAGRLRGNTSRIESRPFLAPHHTVTAAGLIGGGFSPRPGEVSLAHGGVLFLDELPEFRSGVLDLLRQPLEEGEVRLVRGGRAARFPCRFMLVAAMNPCPCGFLGSHRPCRCTEGQTKRYRGRVGGPLMDRIDLHVLVPQLRAEEISATVGPRVEAESSETVAARVRKARDRQTERSRARGWKVRSNAEIDLTQLPDACAVGRQERALIERAVESMGLSARAVHRCLRVARTIADLEGSEEIRTGHLAEAIQYRGTDSPAEGVSS